MKRLIHFIAAGTCVFLLVSFLSLHAQEIDYTQYYLNLAGVNAGFTGMEDYVDLKMAYRQGWNDFAIKNSNVFVSAYFALNPSSKAFPGKNSMRISNMEAVEQIQSNPKLRRRQGVGAMVTSRVVGPYTSVSINGNYAYHLPISKKLNVSLGTRVAYGSQRVDFNGFIVRDPVNDLFYQQLILSNPGNQNYLSIDFGTVLYSSRFYFGLSSSNLGVNNLSGDHLLTVSNKRQFSLQTAATFNLGKSLRFISGVKLTEAEGYDLIWALNGRLRYKELIYVGAAYSNAAKMSLLFGLAVSRNLNVNYSYDHFFSGIGSLNVNVHELVIGVGLFTKYESKSKF